jgi:hypothetical protein
MHLNVRNLKTRNSALIGMAYQGIRHGPPDVLTRIENGEVVDLASSYFRIAAMFETAAVDYDWINRVLAVGTGHRLSAASFPALLVLPGLEERCKPPSWPEIAWSCESQEPASHLRLAQANKNGSRFVHMTRVVPPSTSCPRNLPRLTFT